MENARDIPSRTRVGRHLILSWDVPMSHAKPLHRRNRNFLVTCAGWTRIGIKTVAPVFSNVVMTLMGDVVQLNK
jgi:hypothetical protein